MRAQRDRHRRVHARELLDRDRVGQRVAPAAAVLLRERDAHQPELAELLDDRVRERLRAVQLLRDRRHLALGEVAHRAADQLVVVGEIEVHAILIRGDPPRDADDEPALRAIDRATLVVAATRRLPLPPPEQPFDIDGVLVAELDGRDRRLRQARPGLWPIESTATCARSRARRRPGAPAPRRRRARSSRPRSREAARGRRAPAHAARARPQRGRPRPLRRLRLRGRGRPARALLARRPLCRRRPDGAPAHSRRLISVDVTVLRPRRRRPAARL